jgi:uncharacterized protein YjbI with pentapeptide repeats
LVAIDAGGVPAMNAFRRLSRFGSTLKERAVPVWKEAAVQFERGQQWLTLRPQVQATLFSVGMGVVALLLLIFSSVTAAVAAVAAWIALMRHFAQTNADRQRRITESFSKATEQLGDDKVVVRLGGIYTLERISRESADDYWTIMETLCAFVRERARWSAPDAAVSETIETATATKNQAHPPTDIAAVLAIVVRRDEKNWQREAEEGWKLDLRETDLSKGNLSAADLSRANLLGANLSEAFLRRVNLSRANLSGANLFSANLSGANLNGAFLIETDLSGADLSGADLSGANLNGANLLGANLLGANLSGVFLRKANLAQTALKGAKLTGARLFLANLSGANLSRANLNGADLERADLGNANLSGANLSEEANLFLANLSGANLSGANLSGANLFSANLSGAFGDAHTQLPDGIARPANWPPAAPPPINI